MHLVTLKDFSHLDFGDVRRNERFVSIINTISRAPEESIPLQNDSWYQTKATYEFYKNEEVSLATLQQLIRPAFSHYGSSQVAGVEHVIIAHDFCQISYNNSSAEGLGYLANVEGRGIITYNSIAISSTGIPLSLLYQQSFTRPLDELGKAQKRKKIDFEDKESYYWYKGITAVNEQLGDNVHKIHVADREADIYELFFCRYEKNTDLVVRAKHNRKLADRSALWDAVSEQALATKVTLEIPDKRGNKHGGIEVEVRYHQVEILRPETSNNKYESVSMFAIELRQVSPKQSWQDELLHWKLLTTIAVNSITDALRCVQIYCYRWLIERFHFVLKSGTQIEQLQLQKAVSLQKAVHVYSIAAMRLMQLTYQPRETPDVSCEVLLTKEQWMVLYALIHKKPPTSDQPPTLGQAVRWIGRLGGHLGRKSDGHPGLQTVWRGYRRLCDATSSFLIMNREFG